MTALAGLLLWGSVAQAEVMRVVDADQKEKARFQVELAQTTEEQEKGLMNRKKLLPDTGMLFIFPQPRVVQMWMKNTYVPLDMIFADAGGNITHIVRNAQPHDLTSRGPGDRNDTKFVLEVPAGTSLMHGIVPGDKFAKMPESPAAK